MSVIVKLVYAEYESGEPPFVWLDGTRRRSEEKRTAIQWIGKVCRRGRERRGEPGLAVRLGDWLLIQTTVGLGHEGKGPQGVVFIVKGPGSAVDWESAATERITGVLRDGRITVDREKFRSVLAWAARSRVDDKKQTLKAMLGGPWEAARTRRKRIDEKTDGEHADSG
ncbi:hypothetical protein A4E84_05475 [Streptomyces qaidamensis]|uniref:Uncharacterized protein n=1 Tax=Streptomyces qaidamensis TaxID=1783515 RepID=A0A143BV50_9ACTN|nr:hypothetical protein [Streptomyces qaidamensis]AMW08992.1 hypothetical protein A4E84_05475 [Streptomyces qaidamensis]